MVGRRRTVRRKRFRRQREWGIEIALFLIFESVMGAISYFSDVSFGDMRLYRWNAVAWMCGGVIPAILGTGLILGSLLNEVIIFINRRRG